MTPYEAWRLSLLAEQFAPVCREWRNTRTAPAAVDETSEPGPVASVTRLDEWRRTA